MELLIVFIVTVVVLYFFISLSINTGHMAEALEEIRNVIKAHHPEHAAHAGDTAALPACASCGGKVHEEYMYCPTCGTKL